MTLMRYGMKSYIKMRRLAMLCNHHLLLLGSNKLYFKPELRLNSRGV